MINFTQARYWRVKRLTRPNAHVTYRPSAPVSKVSAARNSRSSQEPLRCILTFVYALIPANPKASAMKIEVTVTIVDSLWLGPSKWGVTPCGGFIEGNLLNSEGDSWANWATWSPILRAKAAIRKARGLSDLWKGSKDIGKDTNSKARDHERYRAGWNYCEKQENNARKDFINQRFKGRTESEVCHLTTGPSFNVVFGFSMEQCTHPALRSWLDIIGRDGAIG